MAKTKKPAFSQSASGSIGDLVFDKRGYVRSKPKKSTKPQSAARGNVQQSFGAARKAVKVAGPTIEQAVKTNHYIKQKKKYQQKYFQPGYWATYLASEMPGPDRRWFIEYGNAFANLASDAQEEWEKAAYVIGLEHFEVPHASEPPISAGLQLYWLASRLPSLGIYPGLQKPNANNALFWAATITERDLDILTQAVDNLKDSPPLPIKQAKQATQQVTATELAIHPQQTPPAQFEPLGPTLLKQLNDAIQDNFLPPTDSFYTNNQLAEGNQLPYNLPQILLPTQWNNNQLAAPPITLTEQPTPSNNTISHSPLTPILSKDKVTHHQLSTILYQLSAFILTMLLPALLKEKTSPSYLIQSAPIKQSVTHAKDRFTPHLQNKQPIFPDDW